MKRCMAIGGIQSFNTGMYGASALSSGRAGLSPEHLIIIQKLLALGVVPSYNYEEDLEKLSKAEAAIAAAQAQELEDEDKVKEEAKISENEASDKNPTAQSALDYSAPFYAESNQNAVMNKYFLLGGV